MKTKTSQGAAEQKPSEVLEGQAAACLEDFKTAGSSSSFFSEKGSPVFLICLNRWIGAAAGKAHGPNAARFEALKKQLQIVEGCVRHYAKYRQHSKGQRSDLASAFERLLIFKDKDPKVVVDIPPLMFCTYAECLADAQPTSVAFVVAIKLDKFGVFDCKDSKDVF